MRIGVAAIARPTFDVPFAADTARRAFAVVAGLPGLEIIGQADLLLDAGDMAAQCEEFSAAQLDALVVLQASFADSTLVAELAAATPAPLVLWAFPEARTGGRLRLNSLCGINLAAYLLRTADRELRYLYRRPEDPRVAGDLARLLDAEHGEPAAAAPPPEPTPEQRRRAAGAVARLADARIGVVGDRPTGFEPCGYDGAALAALTGTTVDAVPLPQLFATAAAGSEADVAEIRGDFATALDGLGEVDAGALDKSIRIHVGLRDLARKHAWDAVATRCWPECFTEFGGAACAPQARLNDRLGIPGLCEADAYGAVTSLMLQSLVDEPTFVADLVDVDTTDDTAVFWHCGLAPYAMADPECTPHATVHSNRRLPLLNEFPLKPGRITIARLSQSRGRHRLVVGGGEMVSAPLAFSGTAGVARLDRPAAATLDTVMNEGLEHHYGIAYGDVRGELHAVAAELDLPVVVL